MRYLVVHSERYTLENKVSEYNSLEELKNRYPVYWNYVEAEVLNLDVGNDVDVHYDDYISLNVKRLA